jgi:hypothetical protein
MLFLQAFIHGEYNMSLIQFSQNLADAEAPPQLPPGEYPAICVAAVPGISKSSGNPVLPLTFKINKQDFPADFETDADELTLIFNSLTTRDTQQDRFRVRKICEALGVPLSNALDPNDFLNKQCRVKVEHQPDLEGNPRANIRAILPF